MILISHPTVKHFIMLALPTVLLSLFFVVVDVVLFCLFFQNAVTTYLQAHLNASIENTCYRKERYIYP